MSILLNHEDTLPNDLLDPVSKKFGFMVCIAVHQNMVYRLQVRCVQLAHLGSISQYPAVVQGRGGYGTGSGGWPAAQKHPQPGTRGGRNFDFAEREYSEDGLRKL